MKYCIIIFLTDMELFEVDLENPFDCANAQSSDDIKEVQRRADESSLGIEIRHLEGRTFLVGKPKADHELTSRMDDTVENVNEDALVGIKEIIRDVFGNDDQRTVKISPVKTDFQENVTARKYLAVSKLSNLSSFLSMN